MPDPLVIGSLGAMGGVTLALNVMFQSGLGFTPLDAALSAVAIPAPMSLGLAAVGTVLRPGRRRPRCGAFVGAAADALLVAVALLAIAWGATWWVPEHARTPA